MEPIASPPLIHHTNAGNPTGANLLRLAGTRLYFGHVSRLNGPRTAVLLGTQQRLTFVADLEGHVPPEAIRDVVIRDCGLYPHQVDSPPAPRLPRPSTDQRP